jgi:hypothetical protein
MHDSKSILVENFAPDFSNWSCPLPLADYPTIVMGHGGGGKLGNELVEHLFLPAFRNPALENLGDAAALDLGSGRIAMSTDSFVVQPLFFPGGSIGELAVNGTANDLAVSGATPKYLSASFILEEGFPLASLRLSSSPWPQPRRTPACRLLPAIPRWWSADTATAATSTRRASACCAMEFTWGHIVRNRETRFSFQEPLGIMGWRS